MGKNGSNEVFSVTTGEKLCNDYPGELDIKSPEGGGRYVYTEHVDNRPSYTLATDANWGLIFSARGGRFDRWTLERKQDGNWRAYTTYSGNFQPECPPDNSDGKFKKQTSETFSITNPSASTNYDATNNDSSKCDNRPESLSITVTNGEGSKFTGTWVLDERSKDADQPGYKLADGDKFYYYAQMD